MRKEEELILIQAARGALRQAYAPYSEYKVGAAILVPNGNIYKGANIETAVHHTTHAERFALNQAIYAGERRITAVAVATIDELMPFPCGQCLQDLTELDDGKGEMIIIAGNLDDYRVKALQELLPYRFGPINLGMDITKQQ